MPKTATVRARVDGALKSDVEAILSQLGLTTSDAINLFMNQVKINRGLPFALKLPNKTTQDTFAKTDQGDELVSCDDAEEMYKNLGI